MSGCLGIIKSSCFLNQSHILVILPLKYELVVVSVALKNPMEVNFSKRKTNSEGNEWFPLKNFANRVVTRGVDQSSSDIRLFDFSTWPDKIQAVQVQPRRHFFPYFDGSYS